MAVIINQAICGEQNKAWGLLGTTLTDIGVAKKIAFKADLQDSPPAGVPWVPVIRGFLFNEYYLLIKTYPDKSPDVRKGRVFSHCLIVLKSDLHKISDLTELFSFFKDKIDKTISLDPIVLSPKNESKVVLKPALQMRFNKSIQGFVSFLNNEGSIIWIGQKDYEIAVAKFWQLLSSLQKELFHFGINFTPSEISKNKINFIVTPENQETKFEGKGFCIVKINDSVILTEFSEQFLAGEENAITRLSAFTSSIEVDIAFLTPREISTIAKGVNTFENLDNTNDIKLLSTLSNIVAKYSPDEKKGIHFKKRLLDKMCTIVETTSENDILLLKNFQTQSFKGSEKKIIQTVNIWLDNYLLSEKENRKKDFTSILIELQNSVSPNLLINLASERIKTFLSQINETSANIVWIWASNDSKILKIISSDIENSKEAEDFFILTFPAQPSKLTLKEVRIIAEKKGWLRLHATIVKFEFNFTDAVIEQLKIDTDINNFAGIEIIVKGVDQKDIIDVTVSNGDQRFISLSGNICHSDSTLLGNIEIESLNWQEILLAAIMSGNKVSDGIINPIEQFYKLLDALLVGKFVNENLLLKISESDFGNILNYPRRNEIWSKFPNYIRNNFLEKTSTALLEGVSKNSTFQIPTDKELSDYIISNGISTFLYYNRSNIKATLPIFNTFTHLPQYILRDYTANYSGKLDVVDSTQLGKLVISRNYTDVAYKIYEKAYQNKSFRKALTECYSLLDIISRCLAWGMGLISQIEITKDEWWEAFIELAYKLYSSGPRENKIWSESNGEEYDLLINGTGKEVWIAALQKLRQNGCTGITVKKLMKSMLKDFPNNEELKTLKNLNKEL